MIAAGAYTHRVRLERRVPGAGDGYGNVLEAWAAVATVWARWRPEYGREALAAGRVEASRAGVVGLRASAVTRAMTTADRLVFVAGPETGAVAAIVSIVPAADEIEAVVALGRPA